MIHEEVQELLSFVDKNPTAFHTTASIRELLLKEGFTELLESRKWDLTPGEGYFVCRNGSSVIAFRLGTDLKDYSFNVAAAHTDSPCFKIKENAELHMGQKYTRLNTEGYGGMICSTWLDRPLSVAGRVLVQEGQAVTSRLVALDRDLLLIPSVAIHMNREVNDKASYNKQVDMLPLLGSDLKDGALLDIVAQELGVKREQILGSDLYLYIREKGTVWGAQEEYLSSGRLDDQECAFGILKGFLKGRSDRSVNVAACFDNEEVGSATKQGAASTFLRDTLRRISLALGQDEEAFQTMLARSFLVSADNAHAIHPDHPEYADADNCPRMNKGVVIKFNANQHYATDGRSCAVFRAICTDAGVPVQVMANRSDLPGGSTLGCIAGTLVPVSTVDIGLPQLAMHAAWETMGIADCGYLADAMARCFETEL